MTRKEAEMQTETTKKAEKLVYTIVEAAEMLQISAATAYTLANTGRLPAIRISDRRLIIPRKALDDLLSKATMKE
jgi:excisionase family DNA binding protein